MEEEWRKREAVITFEGWQFMSAIVIRENSATTNDSLATLTSQEHARCVSPFRLAFMPRWSARTEGGQGYWKASGPGGLASEKEGGSSMNGRRGEGRGRGMVGLVDGLGQLNSATEAWARHCGNWVVSGS